MSNLAVSRGCRASKLVGAFATLLAPAVALGQDDLELVGAYPIDIELLHPVFSPDGMTGVESPDLGPKGTVSWGFFAQYERNPLRYYEFGDLVGNVVHNRTAYELGAEVATSRRVAVNLRVPFAQHTDSEVPEFAGDGWGLGDASFGVRWLAGSWNPFTLGLRGEMLFPTGAQRRYMGEVNPRTRFAATGELDFGRIEVLTDVGVHLRQSVKTEQDLLAGPELTWNSGVRLELSPDALWMHGELLTRGAFIGFFNAEGGNGVEALLGMRTAFGRNARLDLGVGKGLNEGYGSSTVRLLAGITVVHEPKPKTVIEEDAVVHEPEIEDEVVIVEEPPPPKKEPEWQPGQLARVHVDEIVIRDPIQFEYGTTRILDESLPTVHAIATLMNENAYIGHLVIEGHASLEGSFEYNYDLSQRRAKAIFEELVRAGVHPSRMSFRGMGEVVPVSESGDETTLAANRRVQFHIVRQYLPDETLPEYPNRIRLPWSGEEHAVKNPRRPAPTAPSGEGPPQQTPPAPEVTPPAPEVTPEGEIGETPPPPETPKVPAEGETTQPAGSNGETP